MKRRDVLAQGAASAAIAALAAQPTQARSRAKPRAIREHSVDIKVTEGAATTFIAHPARGGPHPAVLIYMDAAGIREDLRDMARRLARAGFYAVLPNFYYRSGVLELGPEDMNRESPFFKRAMAAQHLLTMDGMMGDTDAIMDFVATQPAAKKGPIGCMGFCMSGPYVVSAAARHPDRIAAAVSIFGTFLFNEQPDSPHRIAPTVKGELLFVFAENDPFIPLVEVEGVRTAVSAMPNARVVVYPKVQHGFAFEHRYSYDKAGTDRLFAEMEELFRRRLS